MAAEVEGVDSNEGTVDGTSLSESMVKAIKSKRKSKMSESR